MGSLAWLNDRTDERVQAALKTRCGICRAKENQDCRHPFETKEPLNRIVHQSRAEAFMDKR